MKNRMIKREHVLRVTECRTHRGTALAVFFGSSVARFFLRHAEASSGVNFKGMIVHLCGKLIAKVGQRECVMLGGSFRDARGRG